MNGISKKTKVCFTASTGGHFEQLMMLMPLMEKYDSFVITEKTNYNIDLENIRSYTVSQINRSEKLLILKLLKISASSFYIFLKERPDFVISTGVLATIPISLIAKLFGKKIIYIESFAKVSSPTLTGKLMYKFADQFYVQWEPMLKHYPEAIFLGGIY
ncbi:PssD/Cps14F family polysaccharide biosynthesis glycosyltransferase [Streptococcus suis]|uniref:PssD/Cps14F family polysaccharide biosynthesis glycosyltransferase n=1 Tax=Streptococcus suis TaxID=1307 RepID=UPI000C1A2FEA|nr:PssD/Cps14F family polysaccharide biosynthesis glycosyltransferase [Streptococcus suis]